MPKSNFLRKKNKAGATADFKRLKAKVRPLKIYTTPAPNVYCHQRFSWPFLIHLTSLAVRQHL